jgi:hypothetical protein
VIKQSHEEGMIDFTSALVELVEAEYIHHRVALEATPKPEELKMRLKGILSRRRANRHERQLIHRCSPSSPVTAFLISPFKPLLMFLPVAAVGMAGLGSAGQGRRYFHFNRSQWNASTSPPASPRWRPCCSFRSSGSAGPSGSSSCSGRSWCTGSTATTACPRRRFYLSGEKALRTDGEPASRPRRCASAIQYFDPNGDPIDVPAEGGSGRTHAHRHEDLIGPALEARASFIEIAAGAKGAAVAQTIDGVRYKRDPLPPDLGLQGHRLPQGAARASTSRIAAADRPPNAR